MPTIAYRQEAAAATKWRRGSGVIIFNPLGAPASIFFQEEDVVQLPGSTLITKVDNDGLMNQQFVAGGTFPVRNPETGELTGQTATHEQLYALLYSLYMQTALARDAQQGV